MIDVFEVVEVSEVVGRRWLVRGRCLETLSIGDKVYSAVGRKYKLIYEDNKVYSVPVAPKFIPETYPFVVVAISTYGRDIDRLGGGLTGDLVLEGEYGEALKKTNYLVTL